MRGECEANTRRIRGECERECGKWIGPYINWCNINAIVLTKDFDVTSQIGSDKAIIPHSHSHTTYCILRVRNLSFRPYSSIIVCFFYCAWFACQMGGMIGDGYSDMHTELSQSPHTIHERFAALTVNRAAQVHTPFGQLCFCTPLFIFEFISLFFLFKN